LSPTAVSLLVCSLLVAGALCGALLRRLLPENHLDQHAKDIVRLGAALIATIVGLVLSLLINSAKTNFDVQRDETRRLAASIILLDNMLEQYGPEARPVRVALRTALPGLIERLWSDAELGSQVASFTPNAIGEDAYRAVVALSPATDSQRFHKSRALEIASSILQQRLVLFEQSGGRMPRMLLVVLVSWLFVLFVSFSLFSPLNPTALAAVAVIALSASGAIFLIYEMYHPFTGVMQIDSGPLRRALPPLPA
jgi:hypothetical protein